MKFLLHSCCAPCTLPIVERLKGENRLDVSLYFFNPHIFPKEEYEKRFEAMEKIATIYDLSLFSDNPGLEEWDKKIASSLPFPPETYSENGLRCDVCIKYRVEEAARFASENGFDSFGTTLGVSLWKNTDLIKRLGAQLADELKISFRDFAEIDPRVAHSEERQLSDKYDIYRQKYCGCKYSLRNLSNKELKCEGNL